MDALPIMQSNIYFQSNTDFTIDQGRLTTHTLLQ